MSAKTVEALRARLERISSTSTGSAARADMAALLDDIIEKISAMEREIRAIQASGRQIGTLKGSIPWLGAEASDAERELNAYQRRPTPEEGGPQ